MLVSTAVARNEMLSFSCGFNLFLDNSKFKAIAFAEKKKKLSEARMLELDGNGRIRVGKSIKIQCFYSI